MTGTWLGRITALAALGLLGTGCASAGGQGALSFDIGQAYGEYAFNSAMEVIADREGYAIEREQGPPRILIQTEWRDRSLFEDEEEQGVDQARTRLTVEARPRRRDEQTGDHLYRVSLRAETEVRAGGDGEWRGLATDDFRAYASEVASELSSYLDMRHR